MKVTYSYHPSNWEAEGGRSLLSSIPGQSGLHRDTQAPPLPPPNIFMVGRKKYRSKEIMLILSSVIVYRAIGMGKVEPAPMLSPLLGRGPG